MKRPRTRIGTVCLQSIALIILAFSYTGSRRKTRRRSSLPHRRRKVRTLQPISLEIFLKCSNDFQDQKIRTAAAAAAMSAAKAPVLLKLPVPVGCFWNRHLRTGSLSRRRLKTSQLLSLLFIVRLWQAEAKRRHPKDNEEDAGSP